MADSNQLAALSSLKGAYTYVVKHAGVIILLPMAARLLVQLDNMWSSGELASLWSRAVETELSTNLVTVCVLGAIILFLLLRPYLRGRPPVYLVDFAVHKCPDSWKFPKSWFIPLSEAKDKFTKEDLEFQQKILYRSGLGDETYVPPWLYSEPAYYDMAHARKEFEETCFNAVKDLLNKTGVHPRQIGVVITNSSLFNPTPSLSATIMNHFNMGSKTLNYNLGGMGCSAGVVAIDLARQMLELYPDSYALVVSHENLTNNWYPGSERSMLVPNCIFRCNGAAMLLSNKQKDSWRAKYVLQHVVRTTVAADDEAIQCVYQCEDDNGIKGVRLGKELMQVAGNALKQNMTTLGPRVLPISEQLLFAANMIARKLLGPKAVKPYIPDFTLAFQHICIHTGGRAVIDTISKQLGISKDAIEPSRAGLYRFGNVSSTSIWYVLAYIETTRGVKKGDKVWQLGFGSGFKCNSAVWKANRRIKESHHAWEDFDVEKMRQELDEFDAAKAQHMAARGAN
eukprot:jgi/Chrzof1/3727/Cz13g06210.t1_LCKAS9